MPWMMGGRAIYPDDHDLYSGKLWLYNVNDDNDYITIEMSSGEWELVQSSDDEDEDEVVLMRGRVILDPFSSYPADM